MKKILVLILFVFFNILSLTAQERKYFEFRRYYKNNKIEKIWVRDESIIKNASSLLKALHKFNLYMLPHCTLGIGRIKYKIKDIRTGQNFLAILGDIAKFKKVSDIKNYSKNKGGKIHLEKGVNEYKEPYHIVSLWFDLGIFTANIKMIEKNDIIQAMMIDFWIRTDCNCDMLGITGALDIERGFYTNDLTFFYDVLEYIPFRVDLAVLGMTWTLRYFWIDDTIKSDEEKVKVYLDFIDGSI